MKRLKYKNVESEGDAAERIRSKELARYDRDYFNSHYWVEDLPTRSGNRGLSYDDPDHSIRFETIAVALTQAYGRRDFFLDVGCGPGLLLDALKSRFKWISGVDPSSTAISLADALLSSSSCSSYALCQSEARSLPFRSSSFDLVCCLDVLEHIPIFDIKASIDELCRVAAADIVLSINLDNPYEFHPTILPRKDWQDLFLQNKGIQINSSTRRDLEQLVCSRYEEYDFFCFTKCE